MLSFSQKIKKAFFKKFLLAKENKRYVNALARVTALVSLKTNFILAVVVFNDVELIRLQYHSLKKITDVFDYVVADTSSDELQTKAIEAFCAQQHIGYLKLPKERAGLDASLYHGMALNWVFTNIIKKFSPEYFGFLDPDIFVVSSGSFLAPWAGKKFWGTKSTSQSSSAQGDGEGVWRLWPGFCFFARDFYKDKDLNFLPKGELDTGGMNYPFFKDFNTSHLIPLGSIVEKRIAEGAAGNVQFFANVVHIVGGVSLKGSYKQEINKKREFAYTLVFGEDWPNNI